MKLLLYCTKAKPRLVYRQWTSTLNQIGIDNSFEGFLCGSEKSVGINELGECEQLNGKVVAECDFEVEKIEYDWYPYDILPIGEHYYTYYHTKSISTAKEFYSKSCLDWDKLNQYLNDYDSQKFEGGYAIHIKNLHIFDKPRELSEHWIKQAPQNMMKVYNRAGECHILISIRPEWLCKILNGEKTIEVRKKVLKEMLE